MNFIRTRLLDEAGEGVISTGIAVLIMAIIGAAMFLAFQGMFNDVEQKTQGSLDQITG